MEARNSTIRPSLSPSRQHRQSPCRKQVGQSGLRPRGRTRPPRIRVRLVPGQAHLRQQRRSRRHGRRRSSPQTSRSRTSRTAAARHARRQPRRQRGSAVARRSSPLAGTGRDTDQGAAALVPALAQADSAGVRGTVRFRPQPQQGRGPASGRGAAPRQARSGRRRPARTPGARLAKLGPAVARGPRRRQPTALQTASPPTRRPAPDHQRRTRPPVLDCLLRGALQRTGSQRLSMTAA